MTTPRRGLAFDKEAGAWFHVSSRGSTIILRPLEEDVAEIRLERPLDDDRIGEFLARSDLYPVGRIAVDVAGMVDFPPGGYRHDERERWRAVAEILRESSATYERPRDGGTLIPTTRLRRFYEPGSCTEGAIRLISVKASPGSAVIGEQESTERAPRVLPVLLQRPFSGRRA